MNNINLEEYISQFPEELQEEARKCATPEELLDLAGKHKLPLPDEALDAVAGGCGPSCKHTTVEVILESLEAHYDNIWDVTFKCKCGESKSYAVIRNEAGIFTKIWGRSSGAIPITDEKVLQVANQLPKNTPVTYQL